MKTMNMGHARAGFTLIEILIAVAIVVLASITLGPLVINQYRKAQKRTAITQLRSLKGAIETYYVDIGGYPETLRDLVKPPMDEEQARNWEQPFIEGKDIPKDPWNNTYQYERASEAGEHPYDLYSYGPKGRGAPAAERLNVWNL